MTAIHEREWAELLHEQPWPHSQKLTERQAERIETLAGSLDLSEIVEDFCEYWELGFRTIAPSKLKTWVLPMRFRTFVRNALKRQPAEPQGDDYLERYLAAQRLRGNR